MGVTEQKIPAYVWGEHWVDTPCRIEVERDPDGQECAWVVVTTEGDPEPVVQLQVWLEQAEAVADLLRACVKAPTV